MPEVTSPLGVSIDPPVARRSKRKIVLVCLVVVALLGAAYWTFLRPTPGEPAPDPGEIMVLEPLQLNLAGGRYLRVGIAMQLTAEVEEVDGSRALDAAITLFTGLPLPTVKDPADRDQLKKDLLAALVDRYDGDVMDVYFTEFVTQ